MFQTDTKIDLESPTLRDAGWDIRPYQRDFIFDDARFIAVLKSRQIGFSEALVQRAVIESIIRNGRDVIFVSTNFTNAKELIRKASKWFRVIETLAPQFEVRVTDESSVRIELSNGSRLIAVPCKASAIRGYTGTVCLDEVAFYENDMEIFKAVRPILDSKPSMSMVLVSTPFGEQGLFWKAVTGKMGTRWSVHKFDVYDAVMDGYNPEVLRVKDEVPDEVWLQEYLLKFVIDGDRYFSHSLLKQAFTDPSTWNLGGFGEMRILGIDVARSKDKTVLAELVVRGEDVYVASTMVLKRSGRTMTHTEQFARIKDYIDENPIDAIAIDARGEGSGLADMLTAKYGHNTVNRIMPTGQFYDQWIPDLKIRMNAGNFHMEPDPIVVGAFRQIKREISASNNPLYRIAESQEEEHSHADEFMAILNAYSISAGARILQKSRPRVVGSMSSRFKGIF